MTEAQFQERLKKFLHSVGVYPSNYSLYPENKEIKGWYSKIWGGGNYQKKGIPDYLMCINGIFFSVETKSTNGTPSELQKLNTARINRGGGIGIILYPEGFEQFKEIVKGVLNCNSHIPELNVLKAVNSSTKCDIWKG